MHILMIILAAIGIHGMLAATIAQDGIIAYKVGSAAVQVYNGYEKSKAESTQRVSNVRRTTQLRTATRKVRHLSMQTARTTVHPMSRLSYAQARSRGTKVVANP